MKKLNAPTNLIKSADSHTVAYSGRVDSPPDCCYLCKKELFSKVLGIAQKSGMPLMANGTNFDDIGDSRPSMKATKELGVWRPLLRYSLTRECIRVLSREVYKPPTADRQSLTCMASRIPYGSIVTPEKLLQVASVEDLLADKGFKVFRARHHDDLLRLEPGKDEILRLQDGPLTEELVDYAKKLVSPA